MGQKITIEGAKREGSQTMRNNAGRIGNRQRFNKKTRKLHDMIFGAPCRGMAIAGTHREPKPPIEIARRIEIADGMNDMVKTARHGALRDRYFTDENVVGCSIMFLMVWMIGPSRSLSARFEIHSGSA
jgi:hypothetical protein